MAGNLKIRCFGESKVLLAVGEGEAVAHGQGIFRFLKRTGSIIKINFEGVEERGAGGRTQGQAVIIAEGEGRFAASKAGDRQRARRG